MTNENPRGLPVAWALSEKDDERGELCRLSFESPETPIQFCEWSHTTFDAHPLILATDYAALLADLAAAIARAEALFAAGKRVTDAFRAHGEATPYTREESRTKSECEAAMLALDAAIAAREGRE